MKRLKLKQRNKYPMTVGKTNVIPMTIGKTNIIPMTVDSITFEETNEKDMS